MKRDTIRFLAAATAGCWLAAAAASAGGPMGTATIKGTVQLKAPPAAAMAIKMDADPFCNQVNAGKVVSPQGKMVFSDGTLPYAFVWIKSGITGKYDPPADPLVINQEGCMYKPHVAGMVCGQSILIKNSDDTNHNIHSQPKKNPVFNFSQPKKDMTRTLTGNDTFTRPEVMVKIKCDVHPWMSAYVGVVEHPFFAVSAQGGKYEIKNVPGGKYKLGIWHEEWGTLPDVEIEVADGATAEHVFAYEKKTAAAAPREVGVQDLGR